MTPLNVSLITSNRVYKTYASAGCSKYIIRYDDRGIVFGFPTEARDFDDSGFLGCCAEQRGINKPATQFNYLKYSIF